MFQPATVVWQKSMNSDDDIWRARLKALMQELDAQDLLGKSGQRIVELDQQAVGRLSRMDAMLSQSMGKAQQIRRDQAKTRILAALARIETGEFGYCLDCGEPIDEKRLNVDPTLPKCLSCTRG